MLGCFSEGVGAQLCLGTFGPVKIVASSPAETQSRNPGLHFMCAWMGSGRACTSADGQCFIYRFTRTSSSFPQLEAKRRGRVLCELLLGGNLTSKMTAQGNPSQPLILPKGLWKQHLVVVYAKWGKGRVWREKFCNRVMHVEQLMSAGWWRLTWCTAPLLSFYLN